VVEQVLNQDPPPVESLRKGLPLGIGKIVARAMAKRPEDRYSDTVSLAGALKAFLRRRALFRLGAAAALAVALLGAVWAGISLSRPLEVEVRVQGEMRTAGQEFVPVAVDEETVLRAGDRFWIDGLKVSRDAHVCVLFLDSAGRLERIDPEGSGAPATRLESNQTHRFPPEDWKWILDRQTGVETLFIVASKKAVAADEIDALLHRANQEADRLAMKAPGNLRGIEGVTTAPSVRREQEAQIEEILRERFPVVQRHAFRHM
jgi:hypothetical protein